MLVIDAPCADERDAEMVGDAAQGVVAEDGRMRAGEVMMPTGWTSS